MCDRAGRGLHLLCPWQRTLATLVKMPAWLLHGYSCCAIPLEHRWTPKAGQGVGISFEMFPGALSSRLSSCLGVLHQTTRTLVRPRICCHSLEKTWLGVWLPGFENVSLTPWSNSCSFAWKRPENQIDKLLQELIFLHSKLWEPTSQGQVVEA